MTNLFEQLQESLRKDLYRAVDEVLASHFGKPQTATRGPRTAKVKPVTKSTRKPMSPAAKKRLSKLMKDRWKTGGKKAFNKV